MFGRLFKQVSWQLWLRLLIPISLIVMIVVFGNFWYTIAFQINSSEVHLKAQNRIIARAVEGGMFDALAAGNNDIVRAQLIRLNDVSEDLKVFVYDFEGKVSFSTDTHSVGKKIEQSLEADVKKDIFSMLSMPFRKPEDSWWNFCVFF